MSWGYHAETVKQAGQGSLVAPSSIYGGQGVSLTAVRDATITAADIASARDIIITAGRDLALLAGADTAQTSQSRNQMFAGVTLKVSQNVSTAVQQLAAVPETFNSGHGGDIYKAIAGASAVMQAVDAALQLSNPSVSASLMLGANGSRQSSSFASSIARPTTLYAGGDILLMAGRDMRLQGTQAEAGGDFSLIAGRDLLIESAQSWTSADSKSSSWNAAAGVSGSLGILSSSYGVTIEGGGSQSRGKSGSITQLNANLRAGGTLSIVTGRDATIAGANLSARDIVLDIGRNLTIASRQDTAWSKNNSSNAQASVTIGFGTTGFVSGSLSLGGSKGSSEKAWVTNQTSLIADRTLSIRTDAHTQIDGALLLSRSSDLTIDTATLGFSTLKDVDKGTQIGGQIGLGIAYGPDVDKKGNAISKPYFRAPSGTLQGEFSTYDRRQDTNATVGAGTITLRTPTAQQQDIATLNRDPGKAQVITKDTSAGTKVYVSSEAVKTAVAAVEFVGKMIAQVTTDVFKQLGNDGNATFAELARAKQDGTLTDESIINQLTECKSHSWNFFNIFVTTAYAADGCDVKALDGRVIPFTQSDKEDCITAYTKIVGKHLEMQLNKSEITSLICFWCARDGSDIYYEAFSGNGVNRNDPDKADVKNEGPIPPGSYYIVEKNPVPVGTQVRNWFNDVFRSVYYGTTVSQSEWFALVRSDTMKEEVVVNGTTRNALRLHPGRLSEGCVTMCNEVDFKELKDILLGGQATIINGRKVYGTVIVKP